MTETEIAVECTSIAEWIEAGDQAHIVLMGDPAKLKFDYKITGLGEAEKYSIELVFTPDLTQRFTRSYKPDGSWKFFCKREDPPADGEKFTDTYTHKRGFETGATWMKEPVHFNNIVFRTTREGAREKDRERVCRKSERRKNEVYLEGRLKYQVAVSIRKEGVEEAVYEKDVPRQVFVSCGQRSEHEEELNKRKRKSEGGEEVDKKRRDLDGRSEDVQPRSSEHSTSKPESSQARSSQATTPEDQASSSRGPTRPPEFGLPNFGQVPPPGAIPTIIIRPPTPYQEPFQPSNGPPAPPPPVEEAPADDAPADDAQEEPRPQIGTNQFSAFRKYTRRPT